MDLPLLQARVAEMEVRRYRPRIDVDRLLIRARRHRHVAAPRLRAADLVAQEPEDLQMLVAVLRIDLRDLLADARRFAPLLLILVELLQVDEGVEILRVEPQDLLKRLVRAIDEAGMPEIEPKT